MAALEIEIKTSSPEKASNIHARWATLYIGGVDVFTDYVYDVDRDGNRTEEQAKQNLLHLFGTRLKRLLEDG